MDQFRVYAADELGPDGYPPAWHLVIKHQVRADAGDRCVRCGHPYRVGVDGIMEPASAEGAKLARELGIPARALDLGLEPEADRREPSYLDEMVTKARRTHWSPCDEQCTHTGPLRLITPEGDVLTEGDAPPLEPVPSMSEVRDAYPTCRIEAAWRILTVHHLDGDKANCRWWNLAALCQRCHLQVQGRVQMARVWPWEHSEWFRPYVAGYYAWTYLGEDLEQPEVELRMDELLDLERVA